MNEQRFTHPRIHKEREFSQKLADCNLCIVCSYGLAPQELIKRRSEFLEQENFGGYMNFTCHIKGNTIFKKMTEEPATSGNTEIYEKDGKKFRRWSQELQDQRIEFKNKIRSV